MFYNNNNKKKKWNPIITLPRVTSVRWNNPFKMYLPPFFSFFFLEVFVRLHNVCAIKTAWRYCLRCTRARTLYSPLVFFFLLWQCVHCHTCKCPILFLALFLRIRFFFFLSSIYSFFFAYLCNDTDETDEKKHTHARAQKKKRIFFVYGAVVFFSFPCNLCDYAKAAGGNFFILFSLPYVFI